MRIEYSGTKRKFRARRAAAPSFRRFFPTGIRWLTHWEVREPPSHFLTVQISWARNLIAQHVFLGCLGFLWIVLGRS